MGKNKYQKNKFLDVTVGNYSVKKNGEINVPFSFHDARFLIDNIPDNKLQGRKFELDIDNENSFCAFNKLVFNEYKIINNAFNDGAFCMGAEFYLKENSRYEAVFEMECFKPKSNTTIYEYLKINCKSIVFMSDECENTEFPPQF